MIISWSYSIINNGYKYTYYLSTNKIKVGTLVIGHIFTRSPNRNAKEDVYEQMRNAILVGKLKQGDRIVEMDISGQMGISRAPVREAIRLLEQEGLVIALPNKGAYVNGLYLKDAREIFSLRIVLERFVVNLAVPNMTEADFEYLYELIEVMRECGKEGNYTKLVEYDVKFHEYIYSKANHNRLQHVMSILNTPVRAYIAATNPFYPSLEEVANSHVPIIKALRERDSERAAAEIERHILEVGEQLVEQLHSEEQK